MLGYNKNNKTIAFKAALTLLAGVFCAQPSLAASPFKYNLATRMVVSQFVVQDDVRKVPSSVQQLLESYKGQEYGLSELRSLMKDIRAEYRAAGFSYVKVRLPLDQIQAGVVTFLVANPGEVDPFSLKYDGEPFKAKVDTSLDDMWGDEEVAFEDEFDAAFEEVVSSTEIPLEVSPVVAPEKADESSMVVFEVVNTKPKKRAPAKPMPKVEKVVVTGAKQVSTTVLEEMALNTLKGQVLRLPDNLVAVEEGFADLYTESGQSEPSVVMALDAYKDGVLELKVMETKPAVLKEKPKLPVKSVVKAKAKAKKVATKVASKSYSRPNFQKSSMALVEPHPGVYVFPAWYLEKLKNPPKAESVQKPKAEPLKEMPLKSEGQLPEIKALPAPTITEGDVEFMEEPSGNNLNSVLDDGSL